MRLEDTEKGDKAQRAENSGPMTEKALLEMRSIFLTGEINKELSHKITQQLVLLSHLDSTTPIKVFIDSPGGDVDAGFAIYDMIQFVSAPVTIVGMGLVASAAALIYIAAAKERRLSLPDARYLIHQPMSGMQGVATDIAIHAKELEAIKEKLNRLLSRETGRSYEEISRDTNRDYWLSAQKAQEYGLVTKIITRESEL